MTDLAKPTVASITEMLTEARALRDEAFAVLSQARQLAGRRADEAATHADDVRRQALAEADGIRDAAQADADSMRRLRTELGVAHRDADTARAEAERVRAELNAARGEVDRLRRLAPVTDSDVEALVALVEALETERDLLAEELARRA